MEATGWTQEKAYACLHSTSMGIDGQVGIGTNKDKLDSLLPASVGINMSTGQKWSQKDRETISNLEREEQSQLFSAVQSFREGATQTIDASNRLTASGKFCEWVLSELQ